MPSQANDGTSARVGSTGSPRGAAALEAGQLAKRLHQPPRHPRHVGRRLVARRHRRGGKGSGPAQRRRRRLLRQRARHRRHRAHRGHQHPIDGVAGHLGGARDPGRARGLGRPRQPTHRRGRRRRRRHPSRRARRATPRARAARRPSVARIRRRREIAARAARRRLARQRASRSPSTISSGTSGVEPIDRRHVGAPHRLEDRLEVGAANSGSAGEQLPRDDAEREHVGRRRRRLAERLLGRHVARLAAQAPPLERGGERRARDPEVEDLHVAVGRQHHVRRRHVAVHDAERRRRSRRSCGARSRARRRPRR